MTFETLNYLLKFSSDNLITEKEACQILNQNYKSLYFYKKKYGINVTTRGKNKNSAKKREYIVNDDFFSVPNILNCYWAGFIAADGNISKKSNYLSIGLSSKDILHLERLLFDMNSNYKISKNLTNKKYEQCSIKILSKKICADLFTNFNITPVKSLTLTPPNLTDKCLIDAFILGYIDGDGSIGLYNNKKQKGLIITMAGTIDICAYIKNRFSEILGKKIGCISFSKSKNEKTYCYSITDKSARFIYKHFYIIDVPKLKRKWSLDKIKHCENYSKSKKFPDKYAEILLLKNKGLTQTKIAKILNTTQANISWYYHQQYFKNLEKQHD